MTGRRTSVMPEEPAAFLAPLVRAAASGDVVLGSPVRRDRERTPALAPRRSAVLLLIAGRTVDDAAILLEERSHTMRAQPGQYALPGGRAEPEDADDVATALRETREETGLDPRGLDVVGAFAPIALPHRAAVVRPVVAWAPERPALGELDPAEVASLVWAPLTGPGSLTDPQVRRTALLDGAPVGVAFDLPGNAFVWGFTAMLLDGALRHLGLEGAPDAAALEVPGARRRPGR